jgi:hypothetical protein
MRQPACVAGSCSPNDQERYTASDRATLNAYFDSFGYSRFVNGLDSIAIHPSDPTLEAVRGPLSTTA